MENNITFERLFLNEQRRAKELADRALRFEIAVRRIHNRCAKFIETSPHDETETLRRVLDISEIAAGVLPYVGEDYDCM